MLFHGTRRWVGYGHISFGSGGSDLWVGTLIGSIVGLWMGGTMDGTMVDGAGRVTLGDGAEYRDTLRDFSSIGTLGDGTDEGTLVYGSSSFTVSGEIITGCIGVGGRIGGNGSIGRCGC